MTNYQNGKIYKLVNSVNDKLYIGGTCMSLAQRKSNHKSKAKVKINRPVYKQLNEIGWINVSIILIEDYPCDNKDSLIKREQYWIDELKPVLNFHPAYKPLDKLGEWYREHKQEVKLYRSARIICECGMDIRRGDKVRHTRSQNHLNLIKNRQPHNLLPI